MNQTCSFTNFKSGHCWSFKNYKHNLVKLRTYSKKEVDEVKTLPIISTDMKGIGFLNAAKSQTFYFLTNVNKLFSEHTVVSVATSLSCQSKVFLETITFINVSWAQLQPKLACLRYSTGVFNLHLFNRFCRHTSWWTWTN